jgi:hypothetical protein
VINFRYHIVSLMAVFLALAVGIAAGVSLSPSVTGEITTQAEQDRQQVTQLRNELSRRNSLDAYRSTYDQRTGPLVLAGEMPDARVALDFAGIHNDKTYLQFNVQNAFNRFYVGGFSGGSTTQYSIPFAQIGSPRAFIGTLNVAF